MAKPPVHPLLARSAVTAAMKRAGPLRGWLDDHAAVGNSEIIVVLSGFDEESGQTVHGRWAYDADDIRWDARFADIISVDEAGVRTIDYTRFHHVQAA